MKERPILFSTAMVQALLAGRKTQTRRVCKHQYWSHSQLVDVNINGMARRKHLPDVSCPYGELDDVLWVRETFTKLAPDHVIEGDFVFKANVDADSEEIRQDYIDRGYPYQWKPSIHMPKRAARIWLKVTDVRVERVQDITEEDAIAEGIEPISCPIGGAEHLGYKNYLKKLKQVNHWPPYHSFQSLWEEINGSESWELNPWVWVVEFEVLSTAGKPNFENVEWLKQLNS